ncbi:MAG TPA: FHA domain-containing protein, partial [Polyangia bacterium]|nr:FHA domain-containing protein [Polyangia bacterium]
MPALVALFGPKRGVRLELVGQAVIGRSSSAALQLIDGKVSREHCRLTVEGERVTVEDLGSQNGTFVNGERVRGPRLLARGDELAIGDSLLLLDPDLQVMAARFGDATVVLTAGEAPPITVTPGDGRSSDVPALRQLAVALTGAAGTEAGAAALLDAAEAAFASQRSYVLTSDGARGARLLLGRAPTSSPSSFTPVVARALLQAAAKQGRAIATVGPVEERTLNGGRTAARSPCLATLVVPLVSREVVAGFLYVLRPEARPFSGAELALGDAFGALAVLHGLGGALALASPSVPIAGG